MTCIDPVFYKVDDCGKPLIMYPCGKCIVCKEKKRRQWALRMECEKADNKSCYFLSLTYEDSHLFYKYPDCPPSLSKRHYNTFIKELRRELPCKLRYFGVGEYGRESSRPHYHLLCFLPKYISKAKFSEIVQKVWKHGFVSTRDGNSSRMYYIAKYTVKGSECPFGTEKPFQTSSQNPPIGGAYFSRNYALYRDNTVNYFQSVSCRKSSIPRSFENRYKKYIDSQPRNDLKSPSLIRKHINQRNAGYRLRNYLNEFNSLSPLEFQEMRETIIRRYEKKHKHKLNQI